VELRFYVRGLAMPATTIAYGVYTGTTTTAGWPTDVAGPVAFWVNQAGVGVKASFGGTMNAGVAIYDACVPACGYTPVGLSKFSVTTGVNAAGTAAVTANAGKNGSDNGSGTAGGAGKAGTGGSSSGTKNTQSIVPYFYGTFGPATVGVFLASTSGVVPFTKSSATKVQDDDKPVTGSLSDVNAKIDLGAALIGVEYSSWSASCDKDALSTKGGAGGKAGAGATAGVAGAAGANVTVKKCDDQTNTLTVLGARVNAGPGRVEAHYATFALDNSFTVGTVKTSFHQDYTDMMVGYAIPLNASYWLVPVYTSRTTNEEQKIGTGKAQQTINQSIIALAGRGIF
jgi:hypothetical protein